MNITNGPQSGDLLPSTSLSSGSDVMVRNPPSIVPGMVTANMDMSSISMLMSGMSLENLGLDMSLEEAVTKVRDLAKENAKLREDAQKNNQTMKQQYQTLSDWKMKWESERDEVRKRHDQARTVVMNLREQLKKCEEANKELQLELAQQDTSGTPQVSQSIKAELLTIEQAKAELEKKCAIFTRQIQVLVEELQETKTAKEEHITELDKYVRIVHENDQKTQKLENTNKMLEDEIQSLKKMGEENLKLQEERKKLTEEKELLQAEIENASYIQVQVPGVEESDACPFNDEEITSGAYSSGTVIQDVESAAKPVYGHYNSGQLKQLQSGNYDSGLKSEKAMSDLLAQLQEERTKVSNLIAENQNKNQEMEALHKKVHRTEELLAESDYKLKMAIAKREVEHNKAMEDLKMKIAHLGQELERSRTLSASRSSLDSQPTSADEEVKNLRIQVTSLVGELQQANAKVDSMNDLYQKQKERIQNMEANVERQKEEMEIQRSSDDELIETLRQTINRLETQSSVERKDKEEAIKAAQKVHYDYGILVKHYHEASKKLEVLQNELDQQRASLTNSQKKGYEERIDNLTAQLVTAEESMQQRGKRIAELEHEKTKVQKHYESVRREMDMVAVHKAQAEVYKGDFEAEREAREKAHSDIVNLKEEISQLNMRNQQLQEEIDNISQNQIQQMQMRHGTSNLNRFGYGGPYGGGGVSYPPQYRGEPAEHGRGVDSHGIGGGTGSMGGGGGAIGSQARNPPTEQEEHIYECPKCGEQSPDLDTLQLHVLDCVD